MKLLFDQNISFRILRLLTVHFPECQQVQALGLQNKGDREIWDYAKTHELVIVTFDADFYELSNLYGHPPKIIWLRTGNTTTQNIADLLIAQRTSIDMFMTETGRWSCLEIY